MERQLPRDSEIATATKLLGFSPFAYGASLPESEERVSPAPPPPRTTTEHQTGGLIGRVVRRVAVLALSLLALASVLALAGPKSAGAGPLGIQIDSATCVATAINMVSAEPQPGDLLRLRCFFANHTAQVRTVRFGVSVRDGIGRVWNDAAGGDAVFRLLPRRATALTRGFLLSEGAAPGQGAVLFGLWSGAPGASTALQRVEQPLTIRWPVDILSAAPPTCAPRNLWQRIRDAYYLDRVLGQPGDPCAVYILPSEILLVGDALGFISPGDAIVTLDSLFEACTDSFPETECDKVAVVANGAGLLLGARAALVATRSGTLSITPEVQAVPSGRGAARFRDGGRRAAIWLSKRDYAEVLRVHGLNVDRLWRHRNIRGMSDLIGKLSNLGSHRAALARSTLNTTTRLPTGARPIVIGRFGNRAVPGVVIRAAGGTLLHSRTIAMPALAGMSDDAIARMLRESADFAVRSRGRAEAAFDLVSLAGTNYIEARTALLRLLRAAAQEGVVVRANWDVVMPVP